MPSPVASGPPSSFAELYREHAARVARWAQRLGGPDADVEDIVQEVFLVVSRKWAEVRRDPGLVSWLFQITRRIVANQRRRLHWKRLWSRERDLASLPCEGAGPDGELERAHMLALFHRALDRLPEKQRTVFLLFELEGLSTAAIATLTGRNLSTVKVQLVRARERFLATLRRLLQSERGSDDAVLERLAERVVKASVPSPARLGKKTS